MGIAFCLSFTLCLVFLHVFLSSKHKKHPKTHQNFLIILSSPKTQGIILIPNLLFLGSTLGIWDLGVWMKLFSRDGNLDPTRGYPARPDPNGSDFIRPDKE